MRKVGLLLLCVAAACSSKPPRLPATPQGSALLEVRGAVKGGAHALGRADLEQLPRLKLSGAEPRTGRVTAWEGTSVAALVSDRVDLEEGRGHRHRPDRRPRRDPHPAHGHPPAQAGPRGPRRRRAPRDPGARVAHRRSERARRPIRASSAWWARDVVAFEIVEWRQTFGPALATPDGAADAARRGAGSLRGVLHRLPPHARRGRGARSRADDGRRAAAPGRRSSSLLASHPGWTERPARDLAEDDAGELWTFLRAVAAGRRPRPTRALAAEPPARHAERRS